MLKMVLLDHGKERWTPDLKPRASLGQAVFLGPSRSGIRKSLRTEPTRRPDSSLETHVGSRSVAVAVVGEIWLDRGGSPLSVYSTDCLTNSTKCALISPTLTWIAFFMSVPPFKVD